MPIKIDNKDKTVQSVVAKNWNAMARKVSGELSNGQKVKEAGAMLRKEYRKAI